MKLLKIKHNAGFFSCCSKRLEGIVWFFNKNKCLPDKVDSKEQFSFYKSTPSDDVTSLYFKKNNIDITYKHDVDFNNDMQFLDYKGLDFNGLKPFIEKYFSPSENVEDIISIYEKKYAIDYNNTCVVYYRGNDKRIETNIATYETFILKAREVKKQNPTIKFLVQSDETEFLEAFLMEFPESIFFEEIPSMNKKESFTVVKLPLIERVEHGANFFGAVIVLSKCKYIITHSGNCGLWCVIYRGNYENVYQWLNDSWNNSNVSIFTIWQKNKKYIKSLFKKRSGWEVIKT
jgi:hypothetical protein